MICLIVVAGLLVPGAAALAANAPTAHVADPTVGPHAKDEATHGGRPITFAPATGAPQARRIMPALSVAAAGPVPGGRLSREVFGFAPYWALSQNANWNYSLLSTVAYFGLTLNGDGSFSTTDAGWSGWNSQALVDMINRAHQAGVRVVLVIKTFNEASINQIVTSTTVSQTAINNTLAAVAAKRLDGVNVDFEGYSSASYPNIQTGLTNFVAQLTVQLHRLWPAAIASVDTYSGSASWDGGFFNISTLAPVTDAIFVMAYDMAFANTSGRASANAPLNGATYNDNTAVRQYLAKAPASKIILGVPYYGYKWSTTSNLPNASTAGGATAEPYSGIAGDFACAVNLRTAWDTAAGSPWASWWSPAVNDPCGGNHNSWRELYFDDARSLGLKYDLVNAANLRGTGMWALGYDGNSAELWNEIALKFVYPFHGVYALEAYGGVHPNGGSLPLNVSAYWYGWRIAQSAALLTDASGGYVLDDFGALHQFGAAAPVTTSAYWPSWSIARDVVLTPGSTTNQAQGYVLEGLGGLHPFGGAAAARLSAYWNWDAARRVVMLGDGTGGYVLDLYGGLHPFAVGSNAMPPAVTNAAHWAGWAIARDVALAPGSTSSNVAGVTLDGWGGVHPFGSAGTASVSAFWPHWDIARAVQFSPVSSAANPQGWVLDGYGGVHAFGGAPAVTGVAYWPGLDIARQLLVE